MGGETHSNLKHLWDRSTVGRKIDVFAQVFGEWLRDWTEGFIGKVVINGKLTNRWIGLLNLLIYCCIAKALDYHHFGKSTTTSPLLAGILSSCSKYVDMLRFWLNARHWGASVSLIERESSKIDMKIAASIQLVSRDTQKFVMCYR